MANKSVTAIRILTLCLLVVVFVTLESQVIPKAEAKIYTRCKLAVDLYTKHKIPWKYIRDWICIAETATGLNTSYVQNIPTNTKNYNYGIFRINNRFWCHDGREEKNDCKLNCTELLEDDITKSIQCAQIIYENDDQFAAWSDWRKHCKNQNLKKYTKNCTLFSGQIAPKIKSALFERNKTFELGIENQYLNCEADGNPPPDLQWEYNQTEFPELFTKSDDPLPINPTNGGRTNLKLLFPKVNYTYNGTEFQCVAENLAGEETSIFKVNVVPQKSNTAAAPNILSYVMGIGLAITLLISAFIIVCLIFGYRIYKRSELGLTQQEIKEFEDGDPQIFQKLIENNSDNYVYTQNIQHRPYNKLYELAEDRIKIDKDKILGSGQFGVVMKGEDTLTSKPIAVKTINSAINSSYSKLHLKSLLSELKVMIYLGEHPNIVNLIGARTSQLSKGHAYIFVEFCELGDLENYLRQRKDSFVDLASSQHASGIFAAGGSGVTYCNLSSDSFNTSAGASSSSSYICNTIDFSSSSSMNTLSLPGINSINSSSSSSSSAYQSSFYDPDSISTLDLYRWSYQIASGMEYLSSKKVIHGDLATRNILLSDKNTAKITDFGLSKQLYNYTNYVKSQEVPLPWRWLSLESLLEMSFSTQSDIWSFGITLWEIFSLGEIPYSAGVQFSLEFIQRLQNGFRLSKPKFGSIELYETIMEQCWVTKPSDRLSFESIRIMLYELFEMQQRH